MRQETQIYGTFTVNLVTVSLFSIFLVKFYRILNMSSEQQTSESEQTGEEVWDVEKVVDVRMNKGRKEYLLKWKGYKE